MGTTQPKCGRRSLLPFTDGTLTCYRVAAWEYVVDPDGGLAEQPRAYLCEKHVLATTPRGYIRRRVA